MLMHYKLSSIFLLLLPIGIVHASSGSGGGGGDREIFPREASDLPTVYHPFNPAVKFRRVEVVSESTKRGYFTNPHEPAGGNPERAPQRVLHLDSALQALPCDTSVVGATADRRHMITSTEEWPHRAHGCLIIRFAQQIYGGSGVLVGPRHLLTCAHNVYWPEKKIWAERIQFYPALKNGDAPYDGFNVVGAYILKAWLASEDADAQDLALLVFQQPVGLTLGFHGVACYPERILRSGKVHVTGYPGDKGGQQMWTMSGLLDTISDEGFTYDIDTAAGQSGGAISLLDLDENPYVVGVHTRGGSTRNSGLRLSLAKWKWIVERMAASGDVYEEDPLSGDAALSERDPWLNQFSGDERNCLQMALASREGCELQRGAKAGNPKVQTRFARVLLSHWNGDPSANKMAVHWLRLAAGSGEFEAKRILRGMALIWTDTSLTRLPTFQEMSSLLSCLRGEADERQYELAMQGSASAQVTLAKKLLENWESIPQDHRLSLYLLHLAAGQQETEALSLLERLRAGQAVAGYENFSTLEEIHALFKIITGHRNGLALYQAAMEGNPYVQTYLAKQLIKSQQNIAQDNRLVIYLLQLAARRNSGTCARDVLRSAGLKNPCGLYASVYPNHEEIWSMMQTTEGDDGLALYRTATEGGRPMQIRLPADESSPYYMMQNAKYVTEKIGDPAVQKELAQRLLSNWECALTDRIARAPTGPTDLSVIRLLVDEALVQPQSLHLDNWTVDQVIYALYHLRSATEWNDSTRSLSATLKAQILQLKEMYRSTRQNSTESRRVIFFKGDNWFIVHWLKRAALSDPDARQALESIASDRRMLHSGLELATEDMERCLTLEEIRCFSESTKTEATQQLYFSAIDNDSRAQALFGKMLLEHWSDLPQNNRLAVHWLQKAAAQQEAEAQKILRQMNLFWGTTSDQRDKQIAERDFGISIETCDRA